MEDGSGAPLSGGGETGKPSDAVLSGSVPGNLAKRKRPEEEHREHGEAENAVGKPYWEIAEKRYYRHRDMLLQLFGLPVSFGKSRHSRHVRKGAFQDT